MRDTDYTYSVARVRVASNKLLTSADYEELLLLNNDSQVLASLKDRGVISGDDSFTDSDTILESEIINTWDFLQDIEPDKEELKVFLFENDFANLKTAIKAYYTGEKYLDLELKPNNISIKEIYSLIENKKFDKFPDYMAKTAENAYHTILQTDDGQSTDILIDKGCLTAILEKGKQQSQSIKKLTEDMVALADIKVLFRCLKLMKDQQFIESILVPTDSLNIKDGAYASQSGDKELLDFISRTKFFGAAEAYKKGGVSTLEKWCDNYLSESLNDSKYTAFSVLPLLAYYVEKQKEVKNLRILISGKANGISTTKIKSRLRGDISGE